MVRAGWIIFFLEMKIFIGVNRMSGIRYNRGYESTRLDGMNTEAIVCHVFSRDYSIRTTIDIAKESS